MKMKLYCSKTSPYSRKVRVVAHELGLADRIEEISVDPFAPTEEFLAANPLSKIPALVTDHGEAIPDSSLIVEYLLTRTRGLARVPARGAERWAALRRREIAEGMIDAAIGIVFEKRRPESIVYTPFVDRQLLTLHRSADLLNFEIAQLSLEQPGVTEITAGVALAYLDFRLPYLEWRQERTALAQWYQAFAQRPSMLATQPPVA